MDKRPQGTSVPRPKPSAIGQNRSGQNRDEDEDLHLLDEILQGPDDDDAMPIYKKIAYGFGEVGTPHLLAFHSIHFVSVLLTFNYLLIYLFICNLIAGPHVGAVIYSFFLQTFLLEVAEVGAYWVPSAPSPLLRHPRIALWR
jgi:hypothetical protein